MHRWFVVEVVAAVGSRDSPEYGRTLHGPFETRAQAERTAARFNAHLALMRKEVTIGAKAIVSVMWANATVAELRELWADHPFFASESSSDIHIDQR